METGDTPGPDPRDLHEAIAQAHEHLVEKGVPEPVIPEEPQEPQRQQSQERQQRHRPGPRRWVGPAVLILAGVVAGVGYLAVSSSGAIPVSEQEADLRWAVGQVVTRIEVFRREKGRLPTQEDLFGLLSDAVVYTRQGDGFLVTGTTGALQVEYDGTVPLSIWLEQSDLGETTGPG